MDQVICASLSHTHYWYEVGIMLKVPADIDSCNNMPLRSVRGESRAYNTPKCIEKAERM